MSLDEIKELAGHREVSPWIVKLVQEAIELERESCYRVAIAESSSGSLYGWPECAMTIAKAIQNRSK